MTAISFAIIENLYICVLCGSVVVKTIVILESHLPHQILFFPQRRGEREQSLDVTFRRLLRILRGKHYDYESSFSHAIFKYNWHIYRTNYRRNLSG